MFRIRPQFVVLFAIFAAQALLIRLFSLTDEPLLVLAMLGSSLGSALMLLDDARRRPRACAADTPGHRD